MSQPTPPVPQKLGSLSMCIAVDKSGSTYGPTLKAEVDVIHQLLHHREDPKNQPVLVLPWCDETSQAIRLGQGYHGASQLNRLSSGGGTHPSVLYDSPACLGLLRASNIWVLMTDGKIMDNLVEDFATRTTDVGLHNKASVIIVFGDTSFGRPAACDISVGIAIYAVTPDCIFLFHDVYTGIVRIMQAKGRFKQLLPVTGKQRPKLVVTKYTAWAELPRTSYEDIVNVELTTIRDLDSDEMALENGLIINLPDVLAGNASEETMEKIIKDRDNLRSLALASKTRGTGKDLAQWLRAQEKPLAERSRLPEDIDNRAYQAITALLEALHRGEPEEVEGLREKVRAAHESNLRDFWRKKAEADEADSEIFQTNYRIQSHITALENDPVEPTTYHRPSKYSMQSCGYASGASGRGYASASSGNEMSSTLKATPTRIEVPEKHPKSEKSEKVSKKENHLMAKWLRRRKRSRRGSKDLSTDKSSIISFDGEDDLDPILIPGYQRPNPISEFIDGCMLCHSTSVLTLLLKSPPPRKTRGFPEEGGNARIAFPLAMGPFAEMDIISFYVTCDACAFHLLRIGTCPTSDIIVGALCLVSPSQNQAVWLEAVDEATKGRFDIADLMAICVAIIEAKLADNEARRALSAEKDLFRHCAEWALSKLAPILEVPRGLSAAFSNSSKESMVNLDFMMSTGHFSEPHNVQNTELLILQYPTSGFMVFLTLLRLKYHLQPKQIQNLLFQKVMFEVMEQFVALHKAAMPPPPAAEILGLGVATGADNLSQGSENASNIGKVNVSVLELIQHGLLRRDSLPRLESCPEFEGVKMYSGQAIAVLLHKLLRHRHAYPTAVACFNAFKIMPSMMPLFKAPLDIRDAGAAHLISQL